MTTSRLSLVNSLRTRPADYAKDARMVNAYPDESNGAQVLRKRPAAMSLGGAVIGANTQMLGNLLEAHIGIVGAGGGLVTLNETSTTSANTFTSATKTTGANCTTVTPNVSFLSLRGVGDGRWYYRSVRWRVEYYNGSSWVSGSYRTVAMGAQSDTAQTDSVSYTLPSAGVWQWRIYAEAFDTDGTMWGVNYIYSSSTVTSANVTNTFTQSNTTGYAIYPTYGAPGGTGEIYQIDYSVTPTVRAKMTVDGATDSLTASLATGYVSGAHYTVDGSYNHQDGALAQIAAAKVGTTISSIVYNVWSTWSPGTRTHTVSGSNLTFNNKFWSLGTKPRFASNTWMTVEENLTALSATVYRRVASTPNSTTPSNTYTVTSYSEAYAVDGSAASITDATKALITVVADDVSIFDLTTLP